MGREIKRNKENGKTIVDLGFGRVKEFPLDEPVKELNYDLLQFFFNSSLHEIALAIGWKVTRVNNALKKLEEKGLITTSPCFTRKIAWIKPIWKN